MFENAGRKVKFLAKWNFWFTVSVGLFVAYIRGQYGLDDDDGMISFFIILSFSIIGWVESITLYAFGELCEDVRAMRNRVAAELSNNNTSSTDNSNTSNNMSLSSTDQQVNDDIVGKWICPKCGKVIPATVSSCADCGFEN